MRHDATHASVIRPLRATRLRSRQALARLLAWLLAQLAAAAPVSLAFVIFYPAAPSTLVYLLTLASILAVLQLALFWLRRRIGPEPASPADLLTLARASIATTLVALVAARFGDRLSVVGGLAFLTALIGATLLDWLDGPLARKIGLTRLGAVLDIEADSWLTLGCALAAVSWGDLPFWVLAAPLLRYLHPALALLRGGVPSGGGPWWSRVTGTAQMVLLLGALAPLEFPGRTALLAGAALPVSAAQFATMLLLLPARRPSTAQ